MAQSLVEERGVCRLVHKDPEFRSLAGDVPLLELPLEPRHARVRTGRP
jgi:hypothetical protein